MFRGSDCKRAPIHQLGARILLLLVYAPHLCLASLTKEYIPKSIVKQDEMFSMSFRGNSSHFDHFRLLQRDGHSLIIGARNVVYNISISNLQENTDKRIEWYSTSEASSTCFSKGKSEDECHNYIRVLAKQGGGHFLVCGTNSYKPICRQYLKKPDGSYLIYESNGAGKCPFNPKYNSTYVVADGSLYSGTVADFQGITPIIFRDPVKTDHTDYKQLNEPDFVHSFEYRDYVWFFFHESAIEYMNCGKRRFSRVARVCKNDRGGGSSRHASSWTSFLKARLNCSMPGSHPFYFDEIQYASDVIHGIYMDKAHDIIYAVFTTPDNSIPGSAVCAFSMHDVLKTFEGQFKQQETMNSNWLPVPSNKVPNPRPGHCVNDSRTLPESHINFIEAHPLLDQAVPAFFGRPVIINTSFSYRFSKLVVDPGVRLLDGHIVDVLFIGTDVGVVFKAINTYSLSSAIKSESVIIEELEVTNQAINNLQLVKAPNDGDSRLIIITDIEVKSIELQRCNRATTCSACVGLQDPYCGWFDGAGRCGRLTEKIPGPIYQNVTSGVDHHCEKEISRKHQTKQFMPPIQSLESSGLSQGYSIRPVSYAPLDFSRAPPLSPLASLPALPPTGLSCSPCLCHQAPPTALKNSPTLTSVSSTDPQHTPTVKHGVDYLQMKGKYFKRSTKTSHKPDHKQVPHFHDPTLTEEKNGEEILFYGKEQIEDDASQRQDTKMSYVFEKDLKIEDISAKEVDTKYVDFYSEETLVFAVIVTCMGSLMVGFIIGFLFSNKCEEKEVDPPIPYHDPNCYRLKNQDSASDLTSLDPSNQMVNNKIDFQTLHNNLAPVNIPKKNNLLMNNTNTDPVAPRKVKSVYI